MPGSVQLDAETEALLDRLAQTQRRAKADILREALQRLAQQEQTKKADNPYDLIADLSGGNCGTPEKSSPSAALY